MRQFEYAELERKMGGSQAYWYLKGERLGELYKGLYVTDALNIVGKMGWQVVSSNDDRTNILVMREVTL